MTAFAVVDVETTGTRPDADRVIEIGLVRVERRRVVDRWRTFVRPDRPVPAFITRLTGIDDESVHDAPGFDEVAHDLRRRMRGALFVAHNAPFDSGFLRAEFTRAGMAWSPEVLCTVRLSRALLPDLDGYSLDHLCTRFGIAIANRHRALDDAEATAEILLRLIRVRRATRVIATLATSRRAIPSLPGADELPRARGAWAILDTAGHALRAGRSSNLLEGFAAAHATLAKRITKRAANVVFVPCASDLEAQAAEARFLAPPERDLPFLTVTPAGEFVIGAPAPGRLFGPFRSTRDLKIRLNRAKGLPLEAALRVITADLQPVGLLRTPPSPAGKGILIKQEDRLLWVQAGRLRKAWSLDLDESEIRDELRRLLDVEIDLGALPPVRATRGIPVDAFLLASP